MCVLRLLGAVVILAVVSPVAKGDTLSFRNNTGEPIVLWFWPEARKGWVEPPLYLPRSGRDFVNFVSRGKCYLVLRDQLRRDTHIGWLDLFRIASENPQGEILLSGVFETRVREEQVRVARPVHEFRILPDGRRVKITRYQYEEVTRSVPYTVRVGFQLNLSRPDGAVVPLTNRTTPSTDR
jgi:hypothetical protein